MNTVLQNSQDSIKQNDTTKVIDAIKLEPSTQVIETTDGVIIPREAVIPHIKLRPAIQPPPKEKDATLTICLIIGVVIIGILIFVAKKRRKRSN